jgi:hypothetical protein
MRTMSGLLNYGRMAEAHWREHCPLMVRKLERKGQMTMSLLEAQNRTLDEMETLIRQFRRQGLNPQQAHDQSWELVREKYIFLPPERAR